MTIDYSATIESFISSDEFAPAIASATKAGWGGSGYTLELLPDGTWRVLWDNQIGNRYDSPGILLHIPTADEAWGDLTDDDILEEAISVNADELAQEMREGLEFVLLEREQAAQYS